ncbi:hemicentin-2-like [Physella acuta]|uniref:hemicentin-2-like n=1 Tax=Physella acuta TaxID=109671 RepID=UPI0027DCEE4C|nr:hemicentin-2-like [Physella acuta]
MGKVEAIGQTGQEQFVPEPVVPEPQPRFYQSGKQLVITCSSTSDKAVSIEIRGSTSFDKTQFLHNYTTEMVDDKVKSTLQLTKSVASSEDAQIYICMVNSATAQIIFNMFDVFLRNANITGLPPTTLRCEPEFLSAAFPSIHWYRDGMELSSIAHLKDRIQFGQNNQTVEFIKPEPQDGGVYICRITFYADDLTGGQQIFEEQLFLQAKPFIKPEKSMTVTNTSIRLQCPAGGYPEPQIFWLRGANVTESSDRVKLTPIDGVRSAQLEVLNPKPEDYGTYVCTAENSLGKDVATFHATMGTSNSQIVSLELLYLILLLVACFAT